MRTGPEAPAAAGVAERAAELAGIQVRSLARPPELATVYELFNRVWGIDPTNPPVTTEFLRALAHTGGYVVGAMRGGRLVGASVAFFAEPSRGCLYSHITGVDPECRALGVGTAMKLHQRAWALRRGVAQIVWAFDPLVRRNAHLNLVKLGARPTEYIVDFYGDVHDTINEGQGSDRLLVSWHLRAPDPLDRPAPSIDGLVRQGATVLLRADRHGGPRPSDDSPHQWTGVALAQIPGDIESMRIRDPGLARAWRIALREVLAGFTQHRETVTAFSRDGWYVIESTGR